MILSGGFFATFYLGGNRNKYKEINVFQTATLITCTTSYIFSLWFMFFDVSLFDVEDEIGLETMTTFMWRAFM